VSGASFADVCRARGDDAAADRHTDRINRWFPHLNPDRTSIIPTPEAEAR